MVASKFGGGGGGEVWGGGCISEPEKEEGGVRWGGGQRQKGVSQSKMTQVLLAGGATSIIFVATKVCLSQQNFCCDKNMFVMTKLLLRQIFVASDTLSVENRERGEGRISSEPSECERKIRL